ncbi:lytic polysaccharide monooxygenase [Paenibacillus kobensis]|uniref:lytic polysaccharide monooxygenase n=1 Tax=Paenibacillus kobensis TaxID=59841 RepID=UPI000FDC5E86|nr:lytic polysaccharide monooxygenase [Paenibacillus kobensis]
MMMTEQPLGGGLKAGLRPFKPAVMFGFIVFGLACLFAFSGEASAHGYIDSPASRTVLCQQGINKDCGAIQYEPQSVEGKGGFPATGPADGQIAGAGKYPELDVQKSDRWKKVDMKGGENSFTWKFTANHATESWKYYMTKIGWDPNKPLSRDQLESKPFCTVDGGNKQPAMTVTHKCSVPTDRTGYYIILSVWEIGDTDNAFYQVLDVNLTQGGGTTTPPTEPDRIVLPPSIPAGVLCSGHTESSITLAWTASTASAGIKSYEVSRDGKVIGTTSQASYTDSGLPADTAYLYTVAAVDNAGNRSASSIPLSASTLPKAVTPPPSGTAAVWDGSKIYLAGDKITYNGIEYTAGWWTKGEQPDVSDVWKAASTGTAQTWNSIKAYNGGDKVVYNGHTYQAKWWTQGETPGKASVWTLLN